MRIAAWPCGESSQRPAPPQERYQGPYAGSRVGGRLNFTGRACYAAHPVGSPPKPLNPSQTQVVNSALKSAGLPLPKSMEVTGGYLVATYELDVDNDAVLAGLASAGITSPKELASKAVLTIRNAALPLKLVSSYRVTLNGPPPGPGLITRYGSARFSEGGSVSWEPGTK